MDLHNRDIEAARVYHEVTKHSYTSVRVDGHHLDWDNKPFLYKVYPEAGAVALPRDLRLAAMSALQAIAAEAPPDRAAPLELAALGRLLFCAGGLTRSRCLGGVDYHFRAAASAGALYPVEIYLAAGAVEGLESGLYHFSPGDLKLRGLRRGDWREVLAGAAGRPASMAGARAILILSAIFWRSTWKYQARAYRYCFWDAGTMLANLLAAAHAEGIAAKLLTAFADLPIERLLEIDGVQEGLLCAVALGAGAPPPGPSPAIEPLQLETVALSAAQTTYPDLVKMHRASRLLSPDEAAAVASATMACSASGESTKACSPATMAPHQSRGLGDTILRRGSTRQFAREPIAAEELTTIMALSSSHPRGDFPRLTDTYLVINAVEGMEPGAYYYWRQRRAFELLKAGDFRREAGYLCLEQPLGADCSALVCYMAGLESALQALGNRGYRDAHLEAGLLGGRAYLAAYSLDRGATGLTFYDDDTSEFFKPHAAGKSPILMVAIGVPERGGQ